MNKAEQDPNRAIRRLNRAGFAVIVLLVGGVGGWAVISELPGAVIVESRIETDNFEQLRIGMRVRAGTTTFHTADSREGLMYVFRPITEESQA